MTGLAEAWPAPKWGLAALLFGLLSPGAFSQAVGNPLAVRVDGNTPHPDLCGDLAQSAWPLGASARRTRLQRLDLVRQLCTTHGPFLAALGALWLEEGEPNQALIWLERALLLDPGNLGAQADHALALAALGEPVALAELVRAWRTRSDIPAALRDRLMPPPTVTAASPLPAVRLGQVQNGRWAGHREATLLVGHETNLDHSPRLAEITLTPPDGPISLPLVNPLAPRRGAAALTDLTWQLAYSPHDSQVWRTGINLGARTSPGQSKTDWHHLQWAASGSQRWGQWRGQIDLSGTWIGGPLSEPYRLARAGAVLERAALACTFRAVIEGETRTQPHSPSSNGRTVGLSFNNQCPLPLRTGWTWGLALRASIDTPVDATTRPGGIQRYTSLGGRVQGALVNGIRVEASLRASQLQDDEGYSPLLENNARRSMQQTQWSIELTKPLAIAWFAGAEGILQAQGIRQTSNLSVFRYSGISAYSGVRWGW